MVLSLQEMRARMNKESQQSTSSDSNSEIFRFGDLKVGDEVRIRFIEDKDPTNSWFWRERHSRTLRFSSIKTPVVTMNRDVRVTVPAFNLKSNETNTDGLPLENCYKSSEDVIQQRIKGLWVDGDKTSQALYGKFSKKVTYLFQGFIHSPGYEQNKIYRFVINRELFNQIKSFTVDSEIDNVPCDVQNGRDFILRVSEKSAVIDGKNTKVKDYVTNSKWSSKESPLTPAEMQEIVSGNSYDLKNYLPKHPTPAQEEVMIQMYEASYYDSAYDTSWASVFRPDNVRLDQNGNLIESDRTKNIGTEIPSQEPSANGWSQMQKQVLIDSPVVQPMVQMQQPMQMVQPQVQPVVQPMVQMQQPIVQEQLYAQPMVQMQQPMQMVQPQVQPTTIATDNVQDSIQSIMAKLNLNKG